MKVLLVEPAYYTRYPPLGLLKISSYHKALGNNVKFVRGLQFVSESPDIIYVTSLFTYAWKPVHQAVAFYKAAYPKAKVLLGGIYTSILPEHAYKSGADEVRAGILEVVEDVLPDYTLVPNCQTSIVFSSRGCIRRCPFCAAHVIEPFDPRQKCLRTISQSIYPSHKRVVLWDNNFLSNPFWRDIVCEMKERSLSVDFNQGLDARLITQEVAPVLIGLKLYPVRLAYDTPSQRGALAKAIPLLEEAGFNRRNIIVYMIYNFEDTPDQFLDRFRDILDWGVVAYPMRYEPVRAFDIDGNPLLKNSFVSEHWSNELLEIVAKARRVIGYGGAFPPYEGLKKKIATSKTLAEALSLRPLQPYRAAKAP